MWAVEASPQVQNTWYFLPLLIFSIAPFVMGIIFMILYYLYFHPKGIPPANHIQSNFSLSHSVNTSEPQG
jgi:hypothetical protein